jgi:NADH dehydrogenase (ubiquinone) 1 beta subcomplex subunit 9
MAWTSVHVQCKSVGCRSELLPFGILLPSLFWMFFVCSASHHVSYAIPPQSKSKPPLRRNKTYRQGLYPSINLCPLNPSAMAAAFRPGQPISSFSSLNRIRIMRLYRQALKLQMSWTPRYDLFRAQAIEIRRRFEVNKDIRDPRHLEHLVWIARDELEAMKHPDPYIRMAV